MMKFLSSIATEEEQKIRELTQDHLTQYAKDGLRTLCMAKRVSTLRLLGRLHVTKVGGKKLPPLLVTWNTPQGSILGPLQFLVDISDLANVISNSKTALCS